MTFKNGSSFGQFWIFILNGLVVYKPLAIATMSWTKLINFQKTELFFLLATSTMQRALSRRSDTSDAEMDGLGKVVFKTSYYF